MFYIIIFFLSFSILSTASPAFYESSDSIGKISWYPRRSTNPNTFSLDIKDDDFLQDTPYEVVSNSPDARVIASSIDDIKSLNPECTSNVLSSSIDDDSSPMQGMTRRATFCPAASPQSPEDIKTLSPFRPQHSADDLDRSTETEDPNPCRDRSFPQSNSDWLKHVHVTCGGVTVGESAVEPEFVVNCKPGQFFVHFHLNVIHIQSLLNRSTVGLVTTEIEQRSIFHATKELAQYCCVEHLDRVSSSLRVTSNRHRS